MARAEHRHRRRRDRESDEPGARRDDVRERVPGPEEEIIDGADGDAGGDLLGDGQQLDERPVGRNPPRSGACIG